MEKNCDNCMLKKRGDCFGGVNICSLYKHSPNVSASEVDSWPVIMRSNSQSRHLEWKKNQKKLSQKRVDSANNKTIQRSFTRKGNYTKQSGDSLQNLPGKVSVVERAGEKKDTIESIRKIFADAVLVWIEIRKTVKNQYLGLYLMEYKGDVHNFKTDPVDDRASCFYGIVKEAIENMTKKDFEIVFLSAQEYKNDLVDDPDRRNELNRLLMN